MYPPNKIYKLMLDCLNYFWCSIQGIKYIMHIFLHNTTRYITTMLMMQHPLLESKLRLDEYQTLAIETEFFPENHSVFYIAIIIIYTIENGACMQCIFTLSHKCGRFNTSGCINIFAISYIFSTL